MLTLFTSLLLLGSNNNFKISIGLIFRILKCFYYYYFYSGADLRGGCRGLRFSSTTGFLQKKTMRFIGVEVEQETSAPPPKRNPGSAPVIAIKFQTFLSSALSSEIKSFAFISSRGKWWKCEEMYWIKTSGIIRTKKKQQWETIWEGYIHSYKKKMKRSNP